MDENLTEKVSALTTYVGAGTAISSGINIWGFTNDEWQIIGVIGGLAIGLVGLLVNTLVGSYFHWQRLKREEDRARRGDLP